MPAATIARIRRPQNSVERKLHTRKAAKVNKALLKAVPLLQGGLKRLGLEIRRIAKDQAAPEVTIDVLSLCVHHLMAELARRSEEVFFVQIGANDGLSFDPIRGYVEEFHWRGLLVEPQPRIFSKLVQNYREYPQLIFENAAIGPTDGVATLYAFSEDSGLPEHATMLASFRRDVLEANGHGYAGRIEEIKVPTLTFRSLLNKHSIKKVDFLQIDTEGFDYEVLKMVDFQLIKPALIHFENNFLTADDMAACSALLVKQDYRLLTLGIDTIAYQQEGGQEFAARSVLSSLDAPGRRI